MNIEKIFASLEELDIDCFEHLSGSLINHLKGTYLLLDSWGNDTDLCFAGLYHAVYGTSGFDKILISEKHRGKVKEILGEKSEQIVYTYCACDRDFFWPQIGTKSNPLFLDRYKGEKYHLSLNELQMFCELTIANELEIAKDNNAFINKYGPSLKDLFLRMQPYVSNQATSYAIQIFGEI